MKRKLAFLLLACSLFFCPLLRTQMVKGRKAVAPTHASNAEAWATAVTDFVANPRLGDTFREADVAERFKTLIPPQSLVIDHNLGFGNNSEKGIAGLEYDLNEVGNATTGLAAISWLTIMMPKTDPDGVDVFPLVKALIKRKLLRPWRCYPDGNEGYYCEQRQSLSRITVELRTSIPEKDRTPNEGPWVTIGFGRVEGFGEP